MTCKHEFYEVCIDCGLDANEIDWEDEQTEEHEIYCICTFCGKEIGDADDDEDER